MGTVASWPGHSSTEAAAAATALPSLLLVVARIPGPLVTDSDSQMPPSSHSAAAMSLQCLPLLKIHPADCVQKADGTAHLSHPLLSLRPRQPSGQEFCRNINVTERSTGMTPCHQTTREIFLPLTDFAVNSSQPGNGGSVAREGILTAPCLCSAPALQLK